MNELGQLLRETREGNEISLAEAEARTRIRQKFIAAMEAEDWNALPGEVATRGFLGKYATYLGLDEARVFQLYQSRAKLSAPAELPIPSSDRPLDYRPIEMDLSSKPTTQIPWRWIAVIAVIALIGLGAWWLVAYRPAWVTNLVSMPRSLPNPADIVALEPTATGTATPEVIRVTATSTATPLPTATARATSRPTEVPKATTPAADPGHARHSSGYGHRHRFIEHVCSSRAHQTAPRRDRTKLVATARRWQGRSRNGDGTRCDQ